MKDTVHQRLAALQSEYEAGQKMLSDLEARKAQLQATLLRIEGAIQVLQELAAEEAEPTTSRGYPGPTDPT